MSDVFDITTLRANDTAKIHLKSASGELLFADAEREKPICIILYGPGSKQFAAIEARQTERAVKRMSDNDGRVTALAPEVRAAQQAEDLAAVTVEFQNFDYPAPEGEEFGSPAEKFEAFYADAKLGYMTRQVTKACTDWGNFQPGSKAA